MSHYDNHLITEEGPKRAFLGKVQKTIQKVRHEQYGWCFRVWFGGNSDDIIFVKSGKSLAIEVGFIPEGLVLPTDKDRKLIRWAIDRYDAQQQLDFTTTNH